MTELINMNKIKNMLLKYKKGDELEIRKGSFFNKFSATIPIKEFNQYFYYFKQKYNYTIQYSTIYYYKNHIKKVCYKNGDKKGQSEIIRKYKKQYIDLPKNGLRISLSQEKLLTRVKSPITYEISRVRYIFLLKNYKIELSVDKTIHQRYIHRYEIECTNIPDIGTIYEIINVMK